MNWNDSAEDVPAVAYLLLLKSRWRVVAIGAGLCIVLTFAITRFVMTRRYRATAIVRPVTALSGLGKLIGTAGTVGLSGASDLLSGLGQESSDAQKYQSVLRSYAFTNALIERYRLAPAILNGHRFWFSPAHYTRWQLYLLTQKEFDCEYDDLSGNMTLHFLNADSRTASRILGLYIDSLREKLRREEMQSAVAAKASLEDEARATPDLLLQAQLYELIARQVQREKLAQVEADFAFTVIEPPVVPDRPYSPSVILDSAIAGLVAAFLIAFAMIVRESWSRSVRRYHLSNEMRADAHTAQNGDLSALVAAHESRAS